MALDFELSDEHRMIQQATRALLARLEPRRREFRRMMLEERRYPQPLWDALAELGFMGDDPQLRRRARARAAALVLRRNHDVSHKPELLKQAAEAYRGFHDALEGLDEAQLTEPWLGTWGIKEIVAHMVGWHRELTPALQRLARGERPAPPGLSYADADAWNAKFAAAARDRRVADVLLDFGASHAEFITAAEAIPEARFEPGKTAHRMVDLNSAHHYREHGEQIRAWRASRGI